MALTTHIPEPANSNLEPYVLDLIREEREKALSPREWQFRLRGYGYAIKNVDGAQIVTSLPKGTEIGVLPAEFA
ncbi:hypothetical protein [Phaeobacter sp. 11ANDIMAR09]|uniref:hypothetical protein n=1 Tax=Phaeobacter sp. 11ANDIMAR09 TaxID=1225647 RepID=UPI0006C8B9BC|nr:hypothetical protein [Phaeobacter sp. 11ANDIMAR09]KPD14277.1 hypothetical protein AN476_00600 [Phaeobacter sp. 11ANDIMAR09]OIQ34243.1 MAG: hypothetical protein BM559_06615 [Roseobacter sp. MedPE-SWchi]